jgi:hypothetical protein
MPEMQVETLSREQLKWIHQVIELIGEPGSYEDSLLVVQALEAVRKWFLVRQGQLFAERGRR